MDNVWTKKGRRGLIDKLHRGYVMTMIGITGVTLAFACFNVYIMIDTSKQLAIQEREKERAALAEEFSLET